MASLSDLMKVRSVAAREVLEFLSDYASALDMTPWFRGDGTPILCSETYVDEFEQIRWQKVVRGECPRLLVKGAPGGGKSFATRRFTVEAARTAWADLDTQRVALDEPFVPIWIPAESLAESQGADVAEAVVNALRHSLEEHPLDFPPLVFQLLVDAVRAGRALVVIDALDKLREAEHKVGLTKWASRLHKMPGIRLVATCRTRVAQERRPWLGWSNLKEVELAPLNRHLQREMARKFFSCQPELATTLEQLLNASDSLSRACPTPLLITIVCLLHSEGKVGPDTNYVQLYCRVREKLFSGEWRGSHGYMLTDIADLPGAEDLNWRLQFAFEARRALIDSFDLSAGFVETLCVEQSKKDARPQRATDVLFEFVNHPTQCRIAFEATFGMGKTTVLAVFCVRLIDKYLETLVPQADGSICEPLPLPVFIRLRDWNPSIPMQDLAFGVKQADLPLEFLNQWRKSQRLLFVLDGLDEWQQHEASKLRYLLSELEGKLGNDRCVLSMRPELQQAGDDRFLENIGYRCYVLRSWDPQAIEDYFKKEPRGWADAEYCARLQRIAAAGVRDLLERPLFMKLLKYSEAFFDPNSPASTTVLYDELVRRWHDRDAALRVNLDLEMRLALMETLAHISWSSPNRGVCDSAVSKAVIELFFDAAERELGKYGAPSIADRDWMVARAAQRSLLIRDPQNPDQMKWAHESSEAYFLSRCLLRALWEERWRDVEGLTAWRLPTEVVNHFLFEMDRHGIPKTQRGAVWAPPHMLPRYEGSSVHVRAILLALELQRLRWRPVEHNSEHQKHAFCRLFFESDPDIRKYAASVMAGVPFAAVNLKGANLKNIYFPRNFQMDEAELDDAILTDARMTGALLRRATLRKAQCDAIDLRAAELDGSKFEYASLRGAHFESASMYGGSLSHADLSGAHLMGMIINQVELRGACFDEADLTGADFNGCSLEAVPKGEWPSVKGAKIVNVGWGKLRLDGDRIRPA